MTVPLLTRDGKMERELLRRLMVFETCSISVVQQVSHVHDSLQAGGLLSAVKAFCVAVCCVEKDRPSLCLAR